MDIASEATLERTIMDMPGSFPMAGFLMLANYNRSDSWPSYVNFFLRTARPHWRSIRFYFVSPAPPRGMETACGRACVWLPFTMTMLQQRLALLLKVPVAEQLWEQSQGAESGRVGRKLCDVKPFLPALLPEISYRHRYRSLCTHSL